MKKLHLIIGGLAAGALLAGCASTGDDPYEDEAVVEALGLQELDLDRPGLFDELFARRSAPRDEARDQRIRQLQDALERLERERDADREPVRGGKPRHRVGVLIDERSDSRLDDRLAAAAPDFPIRLLDAATTRHALDDLGCRNPMDCAAELRRHPGLRLIVEIQGGDDPSFLTVRLHDLELEASSEPRRIALPDGPDNSIPTATLDAFADQLLLEAADQSAQMPWFARILGQDNDDWLINAGEADGLREDARFQVQRPGRAVVGSAGNVTGWVPGEVVGTVRVVRVAGADSALVEPADGQPPGARDVLMPMR